MLKKNAEIFKHKKFDIETLGIFGSYSLNFLTKGEAEETGDPGFTPFLIGKIILAIQKRKLFSSWAVLRVHMYLRIQIQHVFHE